MLRRPSSIMKCRSEMPLVALNRTAPRPIEQFPGAVILKTARSFVQPTRSALPSKLIQRPVTPPKLLPKNVTSVEWPGAIALGSKYLMEGDSARHAAAAKRPRTAKHPKARNRRRKEAEAKDCRQLDGARRLRRFSEGKIRGNRIHLRV